MVLVWEIRNQENLSILLWTCLNNLPADQQTKLEWHAVEYIPPPRPNRPPLIRSSVIKWQVKQAWIWQILICFGSPSNCPHSYTPATLTHQMFCIRTHALFSLKNWLQEFSLDIFVITLSGSPPKVISHSHIYVHSAGKKTGLACLKTNPSGSQSRMPWRCPFRIVSGQ